MEIRASYLIVGAMVVVLIAGLAAFSVWLVKADVDRQLVRYEIFFEGSVSGLQEGSQVRYRGIPVGRVVQIGIDPDNVERVRTLAEIDYGTPVKADTVATLEMQGVTGIAYVELKGGTQESALLVAGPAADYPVIQAQRSALERVFESTPDLLAQAVDVAARFDRLLSDDNLNALGNSISNIETLTAAAAGNTEKLDGLVDGATNAMGDIEQVADDFGELSADLSALTAKLDERLDGLGGDLIGTLDELSGAANALGGAARQLDGMVGELREPLSDFSGTGLYEFTNLVGESRELVAAMTRITKEFERDPTGFLIGSGRGYEAD
jgi:phospholipid/cholesterol/gamma-HCH transport system substrate-binding protein